MRITRIETIHFSIGPARTRGATAGVRRQVRGHMATAARRQIAVPAPQTAGEPEGDGTWTLFLQWASAGSMKGITVNGKPWTEFNKDKETITLRGLTGTVAVTAQY